MIIRRALLIVLFGGIVVSFGLGMAHTGLNSPHGHTAVVIGIAIVLAAVLGTCLTLLLVLMRGR